MGKHEEFLREECVALASRQGQTEQVAVSEIKSEA